MVFDYPKDSDGGLIIRCSALLDEDGVQNIEPSDRCCRIIGLGIDEYQQRVAEPVNFLAGRFEWAGRLRLLNTRHLHIYIKFWKVDPTGRATLLICVFPMEIISEFMLEVGPYCLSISNPLKRGFRVS